MRPAAYTPNLLLAGPTRLREAVKALTLTGNSQTLSQVVFTVTGAVLVQGMWGEVTTVIGANHTAAHLRLNDQTATVDITAAIGIVLSGLAAGTIVAKTTDANTGLTLKDNAAGALMEATSASGIQEAMHPFAVIKKNGAVTTIDYRYTTTDAPTSGVITWHALWFPLSANGNLA